MSNNLWERMKENIGYEVTSGGTPPFVAWVEEIGSTAWWGATIVWCFFFGHQLEDLDPGNPEVGPQPDVVCNRCGRHF